MREGRLPRPTGKPTPRVESALHTYVRMWLLEGADGRVPDHKLRRWRLLSARLTMLLEEMTRQELAHYYAGVQRRLKEAE